MDNLKSFKWKDHNFCRVHIQFVFLSLFLEWFEQLLARSSFKFCFKLHCFFLMVVLGTQSHLKIQIWRSYNQQNIWLMIAPSHFHARLCLSALARGDCCPKPWGSAQRFCLNSLFENTSPSTWLQNSLTHAYLTVLVFSSKAGKNRNVKFCFSVQPQALCWKALQLNFTSWPMVAEAKQHKRLEEWFLWYLCRVTSVYNEGLWGLGCAMPCPV